MGALVLQRRSPCTLRSLGEVHGWRHEASGRTPSLGCPPFAYGGTTGCGGHARASNGHRLGCAGPGAGWDGPSGQRLSSSRREAGSGDHVCSPLRKGSDPGPYPWREETQPAIPRVPPARAGTDIGGDQLGGSRPGVVGLWAICPWEGFSDLYRDFARPGGGREDGFTIVWSKGTRRTARVAGDLRAEIVRRPQLDEWYQERIPVLERIDVPMLESASFSDHSLHSRGSFEAFRRAGSQRKWLTTHRGGKWSTFYSQEAKDEQLRFFDHVLKGMDNGWEQRPAVTVAVHDAGPEPVETFGAESWPPPDLEWVTFHLDPASGRLGHDVPPAGSGSLWTGRRGTRLRFVWDVTSRVDVVGPMSARLNVSLSGGDHALIFAAVRKERGGREVLFEGSYGFGRDVVTRGWQRLAHRDVDPVLSEPWQPVHTHHRVEPLRPGEVTSIEIALLPNATRFEAGDRLLFDLQGHWLFPREPLRGQLPVGYQRGPGVTCTLHGGQQHPSTLLVGLRR